VSTTLVVVNPASAGGRTGRRWPRLRRILHDTGLSFEEHLTSGPGDATNAARAALRGGAHRVVAVGGDGTINEVVNGFFAPGGSPVREDAVLGLLPSGTGGDFRRTAGIPRSAEAAAWVLASAPPRPLDVGRIEFAGGGSRHFVNIADCGLGGAVVRRVNRSRFKGGGAAGSAVFLWHSLRALQQERGARCQVLVDSEPLECTAQSVVVANGQYFGGGMRVAPQAVFDDGLFDVVVIEHRGAFAALSGLPSLYRGHHLTRAGVTVLRGECVEVHSAKEMLFDVEGEQLGSTPATLRCLRHALLLCAPPGPAAPRA
jgi:YegS/Rv2252/BmrU family lipid kinase